MPRNSGCRRQLNYLKGRTRAVCTKHSFQTHWLPNHEALVAYELHVKAAYAKEVK